VSRLVGVVLLELGLGLVLGLVLALVLWSMLGLSLSLGIGLGLGLVLTLNPAANTADPNNTYLLFVELRIRACLLDIWEEGSSMFSRAGSTAPISPRLESGLGLGLG
jgi:hypothetical protein